MDFTKVMKTPNHKRVLPLLICAFCLHVESVLEGADPGKPIMTHSQNVPYGWSVINNNLETGDNRIDKLIPNPPEGLMFFKSLGAGLWDVNQFQFGRWNFQDQALDPGDSGLLLNPSVEFTITWEGAKEPIDVFNGFFSVETAIALEEIQEWQPGNSLFVFNANPNKNSLQFNECYGDIVQSVFIPGLGWAPELELQPASHRQVFYLEAEGWQFPKRPERNIGSDYYINNYIPSFNINAPIGRPAGCEFEGGTLESIEFSYIPDNERIPVIEVRSSPGEPSIFEVPVEESGALAGYFDTNAGTTFSVYDAEMLYISDYSNLENGIQVSPAIYPGPPTVITGMEPEFVFAALPPFCGWEFRLNQNISDIKVIEGENVVIPIENCESNYGMMRAWEFYSRDAEFYLSKQDPNGEWKRVINSNDNISFVLHDMTLADSGFYMYYYRDKKMDPDCGTYLDLSYMESGVFQIEVLAGGSSGSSLSRSLEQRDGKVTAEITVNPEDTVGVYAIEEQIPEGFIPSAITNGGAFDANAVKIKWGPFFDNQERVLEYTLTTPTGFQGQVEIVGIGSFDGADISTRGDVSFNVDPNVPGEAPNLEIGLFSGLWVYGTVGAEYIIEGSDAVDTGPWFELGRVVLETSPQLWFDIDSTEYPNRFYRARLP